MLEENLIVTLENSFDVQLRHAKYIMSKENSPVSEKNITSISAL